MMAPKINTKGNQSVVGFKRKRGANTEAVNTEDMNPEEEATSYLHSPNGHGAL